MFDPVSEAVERLGLTRTHQPVEISMSDLTRDEWLARRQTTIGGTDVPALVEALVAETEADVDANTDDPFYEEADNTVSISPYKTLYQLWMEKSGVAKIPFKENNRVFWGQNMEGVIAEGLARKYAWTLRKAGSFCLHPQIERMSASLDYEIELFHNGQSVWVPLEIKNVGWDQRFKWRTEGIEMPPPVIYIQCQQQLEVTGLPFLVLGVLFGGSHDKVYVVERDPELGSVLINAINDFFVSVDKGIPPEPDFDRDLAIIRRVFSNVTAGKIADWTVNSQAIELVDAYQNNRAKVSELNATIKVLEAEANRMRGELLTIIGDYEMADIGDNYFSAKTVPGRDVSYFSEPYRSLRVVKKKTGKSRKRS